ncbi:AAA family ATPase [Solimonas sp. C16B3]|uniref:AAA family ATPase n=2 Tax=Solimonas marina TaxID=2714601 RepID=A0A969WCQ7_9GAMM|nr:AAA family ATPase [Solimonas marina]NKF23613.1 AAA family ATPase [Solimonas marina]
MSRGQPVYDERFHEGVNIIRGHNGSGKSTIADFIFFILGGEFDDWKDAASRCDEVQAEISAGPTTLTLRRSTDSKLAPIDVFFGDAEAAMRHALEGWERFPIRRRGTHDSFSQLLFRNLGIPEAQSEKASNITSHQILRLCYSDQRTPSSRLFRYEGFDTQGIREAVGDLICGISGYEAYEASLSLRDKQRELEEISGSLDALLKALPPDQALRTPQTLYAQMQELRAQKETLQRDAANVDSNVRPEEIRGFLKERTEAQARLEKARGRTTQIERTIVDDEYELREIEAFKKYLVDLSEKLKIAEKASEVIGSIKITHCPSCGKPVQSSENPNECDLCKSPRDLVQEKSRYGRIRFDIDAQIRETTQLEEHKIAGVADAKRKLRYLNREHETELAEFVMKYSGANGPREAYLASKNSAIGKTDTELKYLTRDLDAVLEVDRLRSRRTELDAEVQSLKNRAEALNKASQKRRNVALGRVSEIAVSLLHADMDRQEEFTAAAKVEFAFANDAMSVDGKVNFAESSNVFLKNSAILSLLLAAGVDREFNHPRFLLLDNIEDKGMELERSHLFQKLIVERATELTAPFQIIFTTSMMNPELELDDYVIGPAYTKYRRSLDL